MENIENTLLDLKIDFVFQKLFGKQKNSEITSHFLSLILDRQVSDINLDANKRMIGKRKNSKTGRLDVRAKFNDGEDCNIELQVLAYEYMPERMLEYWSGMYDTIWNLREKDYSNKVLTQNIEMHILEIPKIKENEIANDELVQWLKFIENSENKEVQRIMKENKYLKQAKEELAYLSGDQSFQQEVEARAGMLRDIHSMKYKSREDGKKETKIEIAKKMKNKNMPIEDIIELTGLTKEQIEKL